MIFRQYYLACLSHASYLIGDATSGRAVVVDPQRDVSQYLADAEELGLRIERVIETHFHADFLSGHLELAEAAGAVVSFGDVARPGFPTEPLAHGQRLSLGEVVLEIRHTPGHTPESISVVVWEHADDETPYGVLTGDTLFIGDVGRPDLLTSVGVTAEELAAQLYRSLHEQLLTLPDDTRVFPAHGAGSACGKALANETESTIGVQRRTNYALAPMTEAEFIEAVTQGQSVAPLYFAFSAGRNKELRPLLDESEPPRALTLDEVRDARRDGAVVLDSRDPAEFFAGHLEGAINVSLAGRFAEYAGDVIRSDQRIIVTGAPGTALEAKVRLARIGFDNVVGELPDLLEVLHDHPELASRSSRLTGDALLQRRREVPGLQVVDVRNPSETEYGVLEGSRIVPLGRLGVTATQVLDPSAPTVVYCASGVRSAIAASALQSYGFVDVSDVIGGFDAARAAGVTVVEPESQGS
jgi:hydroxyacylglutathione hydrolase